MSGGGRTGSGGLETAAMETPRSLFAATQQHRGGPSRSRSSATCWSDEQPEGFDVFPGVQGHRGTWELVLDRRISSKAVIPPSTTPQRHTAREGVDAARGGLAQISIIRARAGRLQADRSIREAALLREEMTDQAGMLAAFRGNPHGNRTSREIEGRGHPPGRKVAPPRASAEQGQRGKRLGRSLVASHCRSASIRRLRSPARKSRFGFDRSSADSRRRDTATG